MPQKAAKFLLIFCCAVLMCLPLLTLLSGRVTSTSSSENRQLAAFPELPNSVGDIKPFLEKLDDYANDRVPFRLDAIASKNGLSYALFGDLPTDQLVGGNDGYVFLSSHHANRPNTLLMNACQDIEVFSAQSRDIIRAAEGFSSFASAKNLDWRVVIIPTKGRVFPDKLPPLSGDLHTKCNRHEAGAAAAIMREARASNGLDERFFFPLSEIQEHRANVYAPTSFHWSESGIFDLLAKGIDLGTGVTVDKTLRTATKFLPAGRRSDLQGLAPGVNLDHQKLRVALPENLVDTCLGARCFNDLTRVYARAIDVRKISKQMKSNGKTLLFISDSFGAMLAPSLISDFDHVYHFSTNHLKPEERQPFLTWATETLKPTTVLFLVHDAGYTRLASLLKKSNWQ